MQKKVDIPSLSSSPALGLCGKNNKLNASDVCGCGLINLCSKLLLHTISLPIDLQALRGRVCAKVWRCGTCSGNRPRPNCLFFVSWSYWQLPLCLNRPSSGKTNQGLLIAMAFSSSQIKYFHTSKGRQHLLRPLVKYCKYSTEFGAGQAHHHHHHSQDVTNSPSLAMGVFSTQPHWPPISLSLPECHNPILPVI